jgi:hypothetical protein
MLLWAEVVSFMLRHFGEYDVAAIVVFTEVLFNPPAGPAVGPQTSRFVWWRWRFLVSADHKVAFDTIAWGNHSLLGRETRV